MFPCEYNNGFIEYKRTLKSYELKIDKLRTQIYWRLSDPQKYIKLYQNDLKRYLYY